MTSSSLKDIYISRVSLINMMISMHRIGQIIVKQVENEFKMMIKLLLKWYHHYE